MVTILNILKRKADYLFCSWKACITLILLSSISENALAQCACAGTNYASINVSGWVVGQSANITTCQYGGERATIQNTVAGAVYRISTCGAGYDTQLSIYTTGCTFIAYNDDNGPACSGTAASVSFTSPGGDLYSKMNQYNCVTNTTCTTVSITLISCPVTLGTVSNAGPINFCDSGGNFGTAVTVSGQTGTVVWDWGSNNGVWSNNWITSNSSGVCCFPKKTSNSDGNADRIRYRVTNCGTSVTSSTILIVNRYNEAPSSLAASSSTYCANAVPGTITLTATFPSAINMNGTVAFYSGSCGGTLVGSVAGNGTTTASVNITAPSSTTTYYVRYEPGTGTNCTNTTCATSTITVTALANDACASATALCRGYSQTAFTTICATGTDITSCTSSDNLDIWYSYNPPITGTHTISLCGSSFDTGLSVWTACGGTELACNDDSGPACSGLQSSLSISLTAGTTYYIRIAGYSGASGTGTLTVSPPTTGLPYGSNTWNIHTFYGSSFTNYAGYATNSTSTEFNLGTFGMGVTSNPSALSGYIGCNPGNDNWGIQAMRQGFPCGVYNVIGRGHDDNVQVFIDYDGNGTFDYTSANFACCNQAGFVNVTLWSGTLTAASRVQVNLGEGGGDAYVDIDFTLATPAVNAGAVGGIANGTTICTGGDAGAFTSVTGASGGTVGTTNGGSFTYQWEQSLNGGAYTNISGATAATYDPPPLTTGTYIYRRRATDQCGNTNVSNTVQINVVADPTISVAAATTICNDGFSTATLTATIVNGTGCTPQWQISTDNISFSDISGATSVTYNTGTLAATRYYRARTNCGTGCDAATSSSIAVTVTQPPGTPTVYGSNTWNIYTYNGFNFNNYVGYVTNTTTTEFNIGAFGMGLTQSPSNIIGYSGCPTQSGDNWSFSAKRQGFPCGVYDVNLMGYDDNYVLNIDYDGNGTVDFTTSGSCCDVGLGTKWTGLLNASSKVEITLQEGGGNAYIDIDFAVIALAIGGGTIGGITDATSICTGGDPGAFTNAAGAAGGTVGYTNGGTYAYTWESSITGASSGFSTISGATIATYDPSALTQTTWFRRKVVDQCGNTAYSNVIQVIVAADPTATTPTYSNATICAGGTTVVSTTASNGTGTYTYQWQYFNGSTWANVLDGTPAGAVYTNTSTANMTITGISAVGAYQYRCNVGASGTGCDVATTASSTLTVVADPSLSTPTLTNATICIGGSTAISTTVSGGTGTYTYQWQYSTDGSTGWANVVNGTPAGYTYTNATTTTLNIATTNSSLPATGYYRLVLTSNTPIGGGCNATTTNAVLTLVADPVSPTTTTKTPNATSVCEGSTLSITAPTGGSGGVGCTLEYRYTQNGGSTFSTPSGTLPTLTATATGYHAIEVRYNNCTSGCDQPSAWQELARWTVMPDPSISATTQPPSPICPGGNATFSVTASGGTDGSGATVRTFQWQYSADGATGWANVVNGTPTGISYTNATTATLTASTTNASTPAGTYYYRCLVGASGDNCATATSATLSVTVVAEATAPTATQSPATTIVCAGTSLSLISPVLGSGGSGTQVFEYSTVSSSSGFSTTSPTLSAAVGANNIWIRTNPTGSGCNISPAAQYTWTGIANPSGGSIAAVSICSGIATTATVTGVSNATQYLWSLPAGLSGSSTTASISLSSTTPGTYTVSVTPQNVSGATVCNGTQVTGSVTVHPTPTATTPANQTYCSGATTAAIALSGTPVGVTFNISGGTAIGLANQTGVTSVPSYTATTGTATISITPVANGCTGTAVTYNVTVLAAVNYGTVSSGNETLCSIGADPANITLSTAPTGGTGTFTYQWYYQDGIVSCPSGTSTTGWTLIGGAASSSYDPPSGLAASRTYAVLIDATGTPDCGVATWANNCRQVTIISCCTPPSALTYTASTVSYCNNVAITPIDATVSGTTPMTFSVSPTLPTGLSLNTSSGQISGTPTVASPATDYTVTATNACGSTTAVVNITVFAAVNYGTVNSTGETICVGGNPSNITFSTAPSGGAGTFSYQWYYQNGLTACPTGSDITGWTFIGGATGSSYDPPAGLAASRTYACLIDPTGTPDCGGARWATNCRQVTVVADPIVTLTTVPADATICTGGSVTINASVSGGTGTLTTIWEVYNTTLSAWQTIPGTSGLLSYSVSPTVTTNYRVRISNGAVGCDAVTPQTVTVGSDPVAPTLNTALPASGTTVCANTPVSATFNAGSGGMGCTDEYQYSTDGGTSWLAYTQGANIATTTPGTVLIQGRRICSGEGCDGAAESFVTLAQWTVVANPVPSFNNPDVSVCANEAGVTYTLTNTYGGGYVWSVTGGSIVGGGTSGDNFVSIDWSAAGSGAVHVTVTDGNNCTGNVTTNIAIHPRPVVTYCLVPDYCLGETGQISLNIQSGTAPYSISWLPAEGIPATPATLNADGVFTVTGLTGNVSYNFTVVDSNGCGIQP